MNFTCFRNIIGCKLPFCYLYFKLRIIITSEWLIDGVTDRWVMLVFWMGLNHDTWHLEAHMTHQNDTDHVKRSDLTQISSKGSHILNACKNYRNDLFGNYARLSVSWHFVIYFSIHWHHILMEHGPVFSDDFLKEINAVFTCVRLYQFAPSHFNLISYTLTLLIL